MSGVKGRSGRKSWDKEAQSHELWDLSVPVLKYILRSRKKSLEIRKTDVALSLIIKMAPSELKHSGDIGNKDTKIIIIRPNNEKETLRNEKEIPQRVIFDNVQNVSE